MENEKLKVMGWIGAACAMIGSALVASNTVATPVGWLFFVVGSVALTVWAFTNKSKHQLMMNGYFIMVNCFGAVRYFDLI